MSKKLSISKAIGEALHEEMARDDILNLFVVSFN